MKSPLPALVGLFWKNGSWGLWLSSVAYLLLPIFMADMPFRFVGNDPSFRWDIMISSYTGMLFFTLLFPMTLASRFFFQASATKRDFASAPCPDAEFIVTRPIGRRQGHQAVLLLNYSLIALMIAPFLVVGLLHPTVPVSYYSGSLKLAAYREAFPDATVLSTTKDHFLLSCPYNALYLNLVPVLFSLAAASAVQAFSLIRWHRLSAKILFPLLFSPIILWNFLPLRYRYLGPVGIDAYYLAFVRHAPVILGSVAVFFIVVQWASLKRAESADIG
ncbi:hypothetical protein SAMN05444156_0253 [Verrucomicrobium sp. GAS474]|uniref:hypothetical protein n=1 Tax=Verrucomicrobium sp. GAS474 TaxID=1882831 RepID=UPI0008797179|nr:hypothetical protein [Verrucomicrobium sp. GAS474]SDT86953.1 hypothetical protein SAMN05444156_0253 [Verrucomicrobium sp. GAS474]